MAAVWGAQILLYPLYVGFQATRLVGEQLRKTTRQVLPKLRSVTQTVTEAAAEPFLFADTPIQRSLQALSDFALLLPADRLALQLNPQDPSAPGIWVVVGGSAIASSIPRSLPASKELSLQNNIQLVTSVSSTKLERSGKLQAERSGAIQIQGIASLLSSHRLVLVDIQNQLLDVLSSEQQVFLQRRIAGDVASYWRQQRLLAENQPWVDRFLPLPRERTLALPPIRAFWQLMSWMQTGSVASATNLFQESRLLPSPHSLFALPDRPVLRSAEASWKTGNELLENLSRWFHGSAQKIRAFTTTSALPTSALPSAALPSTALPSAAPSVLQVVQRLPASLQVQRRDRRGVSSSNSLFVRMASPKVSSTFGHSIISLAAENRAAANVEVEPLAAKSDEKALLAKPSWIEAEVRLVTYEKHPIEQLLDWLDRGMLWVEDRVVDVWKWLRDRWST